MYDNKIRLSSDVLSKATIIAEEWGLKNARAAVEAVFRKYSDEYLYGRLCQGVSHGTVQGVTSKYASPDIPQDISRRCTCPAMAAPAISVPVISPSAVSTPMALSARQSVNHSSMSHNRSRSIPTESTCEALDALNDLLAL